MFTQTANGAKLKGALSEIQACTRGAFSKETEGKKKGGRGGNVCARLFLELARRTTGKSPQGGNLQFFMEEIILSVSAMYPRRPVSDSASERMKENLPVCQVFLRMATVAATYSTGVHTASLRVLMSTPSMQLRRPTSVSSNFSNETEFSLLARSDSPSVVKTALMLATEA